MSNLLLLDEFGPRNDLTPCSNSFGLKNCIAFELCSGYWPNKPNCLLLAIVSILCNIVVDLDLLSANHS